jgi:hypothetical protein
VVCVRSVRPGAWRYLSLPGSGAARDDDAVGGGLCEDCGIPTSVPLCRPALRPWAAAPIGTGRPFAGSAVSLHVRVGDERKTDGVRAPGY